MAAIAEARAEERQRVAARVATAAHVLEKCLRLGAAWTPPCEAEGLLAVSEEWDLMRQDGERALKGELFSFVMQELALSMSQSSVGWLGSPASGIAHEASSAVAVLTDT